MGQFFRQNLLGIVIISAVGGVVGNVATGFLPSATDRGTAVVGALLKPIPAWVLFPYSLLITLAFGYWAVRSRRSERESLIAREAAAKQEAESAKTERDELRRQNQSVIAALEEARRQLEHPNAPVLTKPELMGLVAVVLASSPPSPLNPINHEHVCRHVAGLAGTGVLHAAIGDALASMLKIGAVENDYRGLFLSSSWKEKLNRAFPSSPPAG